MARTCSGSQKALAPTQVNRTVKRSGLYEERETVTCPGCGAEVYAYCDPLRCVYTVERHDAINS